MKISQNKPYQVKLSLTEIEYHYLQIKAKKLNMSVQSYLRMLVNKSIVADEINVTKGDKKGENVCPLL